jgi:nucleoside-diphosphate-sugar epimerase
VTSPEPIDTVAALDEALSRPTPALIEAMRSIDHDLLILGVGGKMGVSLACLARRAFDAAGLKHRKVIGVSRFSSPELVGFLEDAGVETIRCDLLDPDALKPLPDATHVVYMAARKFGSTGDESTTWAMNTCVPTHVARRYAEAKIVAFSTGNVYPFVSVASGGATESDPVGPVGEYAQAALARERLFEHFSRTQGTKVTLLRLNYAVELRYGVLLDIAQQVHTRRPVDVHTGFVNVIWQRDANEITLRAFDLCSSPPTILNVTGPEILSVRDIAERFAAKFKTEPIFEGTEAPTALLNNAANCHERFGKPTVAVDQVIDWVAHWVSIGGATHGKPTGFERRDGKF